jgi:hypothetical protein
LFKSKPHTLTRSTTDEEPDKTKIPGKEKAGVAEIPEKPMSTSPMIPIAAKTLNGIASVKSLRDWKTPFKVDVRPRLKSPVSKSSDKAGMDKLDPRVFRSERVIKKKGELSKTPVLVPTSRVLIKSGSDKVPEVNNEGVTDETIPVLLSDKPAKPKLTRPAKLSMPETSEWIRDLEMSSSDGDLSGVLSKSPKARGGEQISREVIDARRVVTSPKDNAITPQSNVTGTTSRKMAVSACTKEAQKVSSSSVTTSVKRKVEQVELQRQLLADKRSVALKKTQKW